MKPETPPEPDLLAFLRQDLAADEAAAVRARLAADPALREELGRLEALFRATRQAFDPPEDAREAERVAALVRSRVADEERREARERRTSAARGRARPRVWVRVLAASILVHAAVVVALVVTSPSPRASGRESRSLLANLPQQRIETERDLLPADIAWPKDGGLAAALPDPFLPGPSDLDADLPAPSESAPGLPDLGDRLREHPPAVALDMLFRTDDALKRRRLARLALDPDGTLTRVRFGLREIARRQREDGSFPAAGGRTEVGETALALLPFLGDGHGSARRDLRHPDVVSRGTRWLRATLFAGGPGAAEAVRLRSPQGSEGAVPVKDLGIALAALAEDFMLSFGRLSPAEGERRVSEMETLARATLREQGTEGAFPGAAEDPASVVWPIWGLYAAARTGTVALPREPIERFRRWYDARPRTPDGTPMRADGSPDPLLAAVGLLFGHGLDPAPAHGGGPADPMGENQVTRVVSAGIPDRDGNLFLATAGSALLLHDPEVFRAWGRETIDWIAARLRPNGEILEGDPVGDTALVLLALQSAYRTY